MPAGVCPVQALLDAGANVALGTDGTSSNNTLDMFAEIKLAALLAKGASNPGEGISKPNAMAVPAITALRMATINGAKVCCAAQGTLCAFVRRGSATLQSLRRLFLAVFLRKALGLESKIGSIVIGKEADLIAVRLGDVESMPM